MLKGGTTCFVDMYYFAEETADEAIKAGIRAFIGVHFIKHPTNYAKSPQEYFEKGLNLIKTVHVPKSRVKLIVAPHAPYTVDDDHFIKCAQIAEEYDLKITCHIHETEHEVVEAIKKIGIRPIERLRRLGLINNRLLAVHCTQLTDDEIALFSNKGTSVAHCPESNCKLASGIAPVQKMLNAGVNVCMGTDGVAANNELDMFGEMKMAAFIGKVSDRDPKATTAPTVIEMATINGARALGMENEIGSLEVGKSADIIAINLEALSTVPIYNPISHVVYTTNKDCVTDVWIAGERIVRERHLLPYDEEQLVRMAHEWGTKISTCQYT